MKKIEDMSFEEAVKLLDDTVKKLEKGEGTLSESLQLFTDGVKLSSRCNKLLDEAELKISALIADSGSETGMKEVPFGGEKED